MRNEAQLFIECWTFGEGHCAVSEKLHLSHSMLLFFVVLLASLVLLDHAYAVEASAS